MFRKRPSIWLAVTFLSKTSQAFSMSFTKDRRPMRSSLVKQPFKRVIYQLTKKAQARTDILKARD